MIRVRFKDIFIEKTVAKFCLRGTRIKTGIAYYGFALMAIGLGTLQIILDKGQEADWFQATWICWASVLVVISLAAFVFWERRVNHPVIDLRVFKDRNLIGGVVVAFMIGAIMYGVMALVPLFYQTLMGYTACSSGIVLVPLGIGGFLGSIVAAVISKYFDSRIFIALGLGLLGIGCLWLGNINLQVAIDSMVIPLFVLGFGVTTVFVPLSTTALGTLAAKDIGNGSGLFNLTRNIGGSLGIAMATTVLARMAQTHQSILVEHLNPFNPLYQQAIKANPGMAEGLLYQELLRQSTFLSYADCFRWYGIVAFFSVFMVFLFRKVKDTGMSMVH